jgi:hypothetical protein
LKNQGQWDLYVLLATWQGGDLLRKGNREETYLPKPECKGEHIQWFHELLASKGTPDIRQIEPEDERTTNIAMREDGWMGGH